MHLENVVFDAVEPRTVGRFWETALGTEMLTDEAGGYETRMEVPDGPVIDLCFQTVGEPPAGPQRLRLVLRGDAVRQSAVERMLASGADLVDPGGNPFEVSDDSSVPAGDGPVAALSLDVADPDSTRDFWSWLSGWTPVEGTPGLRHPSGRGPLLELRPEVEPKGEGKNRMHLDVRLEPGDDADAVATGIADRGGRELHFDWGDLPWRHFADPAGNEFCVLPAPA